MKLNGEAVDAHAAIDQCARPQIIADGDADRLLFLSSWMVRSLLLLFVSRLGLDEISAATNSALYPSLQVCSVLRPASSPLENASQTPRSSARPLPCIREPTREIRDTGRSDRPSLQISVPGAARNYARRSSSPVRRASRESRDGLFAPHIDEVCRPILPMLLKRFAFHPAAREPGQLGRSSGRAPNKARRLPRA